MKGFRTIAFVLTLIDVGEREIPKTLVQTGLEGLPLDILFCIRLSSPSVACIAVQSHTILLKLGTDSLQEINRGIVPPFNL
jgi:hypothetical protein